MWSDNESEIDLLRASYLARAVATVIRTPDLLPTSVGVFGDWGSGKSTILNLVEKELQNEKTFVVVRFNGWLFEGYESARVALMGSLLDSIERKIKDNKTLYDKLKDLLARLGRRVDLLQLGGAAVKYGLPVAMGHPQITGAILTVDALRKVVETAKDFSVEDLKKLLKEAPPPNQEVRREIAAFREDFARLLRDSEIGAVVILIDDLDRCLPHTIIETLEAIKLFLFVPGTAFVLAADERLVRSAIRHRFPDLPGQGADVGRVYLEKLVQIPITIPPLTNLEIESYMAALFIEKRLGAAVVRGIAEGLEAEAGMDLSRPAFSIASVKAKNDDKVPIQLAEDLDLVAQIAPVLARGLAGSPRRTKRFLNALLLRLEMANDRKINLKPRILAKLMVLEYVRPDLFMKLAETQARREGSAPELAAAEKAAGRGEGGDPSGGKRKGDTTAPVAGQPATPGPPTDSATDVTTEDFLGEKWTRRWVACQPPIAGEDLRPYFFVAREKTGLLDDTGPALTPAAQKALTSLLEPGEVAVELGLKALIGLSAAEAGLVVEQVAARTRSAGEDEEEQMQLLACRIAGVRPDAVSQVLSLFEGLSDSKIWRATPLSLLDALGTGVFATRAKTLLARWSDSASKGLAAAAKAALARTAKS